MRHVIFILILVLAWTTQSHAMPSCSTLGWIEALRAAHDIPDDRARRDRLRLLLSNSPTHGAMIELNRVLSERDRARLAEFLRRSEPEFGTIGPDPRLVAHIGQRLISFTCRPTRGVTPAKPVSAAGGSLEPSTITRVAQGFDPDIPFGMIVALLLVAAGLSVSLLMRSARDRRRAERHVCAHSVTLTVGETVQDARLLDISEGGCRIHASDPPEKGTSLTIRVGRFAHDAKVVWQAADAAGLQFHRPITPAVLSEILVRVVPTRSGSSRRPRGDGSLTPQHT